MTDPTSKATLPSPECQAAEKASQQALTTVHEIFGDPAGFDEEEPAIIRRWRNGGHTKLRRSLRRAGFGELVLTEVNSG